MRPTQAPTHDRDHPRTRRVCGALSQASQTRMAMSTMRCNDWRTHPRSPVWPCPARWSRRTPPAGGLLNASVQFGGALMLALVTAVNVIMTGDDPTRATPSLATGLRSWCHWSEWPSAPPSRRRACVDLPRQRPPWRRSAPTPRRPDASPAVSLRRDTDIRQILAPPRDKRGNGGDR